MRQTLVIVTVLALLALAGCGQKAVPATATDMAVSDVGTGVSDLDAITQDLDTSDLNTLEQELADIETLELQ